jgi:cation transport regulator ChaC
MQAKEDGTIEPPGRVIELEKGLRCREEAFKRFPQMLDARC